MQFNKEQGFGLLELAVILVIFSVIAGGIVFGQGVVRNAKKQAVISDVQAYTNAAHLFLEQYTQPPGDLNRATTLLGASSNGDGDGTIAECCYTATGEWEKAWEQLSLAGLIEGKFLTTGIDGLMPEQILENHFPRSSFEGGGYMMTHSYAIAPDGNNYTHRGGHYLLFGRPMAACASSGDAEDCMTLEPIITPKEAIEIDQKVDDGIPDTGSVISLPTNSTITPDCTNATPGYDLAVEEDACSLSFFMGF